MYVDGFVTAVPVMNQQAYKDHAEYAGNIFKEYGALKIVECWGDDVPNGKITSFPMAVKCKDDEEVVFSWVTWPSKEIRDKGWEAIMKDPRLDPEKSPMPFDGKRMIYGGFNLLLEL